MRAGAWFRLIEVSVCGVGEKGITRAAVCERRESPRERTMNTHFAGSISSPAKTSSISPPLSFVNVTLKVPSSSSSTSVVAWYATTAISSCANIVQSTSENPDRPVYHVQPPTTRRAPAYPHASVEASERVLVGRLPARERESLDAIHSVGSAHDPTAVRPNEYSLTPPPRKCVYIKFFVSKVTYQKVCVRVKGGGVFLFYDIVTLFTFVAK